MKKLTTLFIMLLIAALTITAQPPQALSIKPLPVISSDDLF